MCRRRRFVYRVRRLCNNRKKKSRSPVLRVKYLHVLVICALGTNRFVRAPRLVNHTGRFSIDCYIVARENINEVLLIGE